MGPTRRGAAMLAWSRGRGWGARRTQQFCWRSGLGRAGEPLSIGCAHLRCRIPGRGADKTAPPQLGAQLVQLAPGTEQVVREKRHAEDAADDEVEEKRAHADR